MFAWLSQSWLCTDMPQVASYEMKCYAATRTVVALARVPRMPMSRFHAPRLAAPATLLAQSTFLAGLPLDVHERLLPHFSLVELAAGQELGATHGSSARALFPLAGVISLMQQLPDGDSG